LKFKKIYVLVGNHDIKLNKNGEPVLSFQFLERIPNIEIIKTFGSKSIEGLNTLFLPFIFPDGVHSVADYEKLPKEVSSEKYDLIVGHFADMSTNAYPGKLVDISQLKALHYALGHVHTPETRYVGSVVPNNIGEAGVPRFIRVYSKDKKEQLLPIPPICDYLTVNFPDELPKKTVDIPIYTVYNCRDEAVARQKYGDIYIRKCVYDVTLDTEAFNSLGQSLSNKGDNPVSLQEMYKEWSEKSDISNEIKEKAEKYLFLATN
jgi:hypothetical protein